MHARELPLEILLLISQFVDEGALRKLQNVNTLWRCICLPLVWRKIEISDWDNVASPQTIYETYGKHVKSIEYRRYRRRRGNSHSSTTSQHMSPTATPDGRTKTESICEWLGMCWGNVRQVAIGAWPPYNVHRVQAAVSAACPYLRVLVLEGSADAWIDAFQFSVARHPQLRRLHITEDTRALLPPAPDSPYRKLLSCRGFLANTSATHLTHITVPCLADSVDHLLKMLPDLLPALVSLDLRQVDAGIASRLYINVPRGLSELKTSGRYPLSSRMLCHCHSSATQPSWTTGFRHRCDDSNQMQMLSQSLRSLSVTGHRTEEAAQREARQFWAAVFQHKWKALTSLVMPVACPEFSGLVKQNCPELESLRILHTGSFIIPQENDAWTGQLVKLQRLRFLDIASSNNEYEGCCLTSRLVTDFSWAMPWLHTLYTSRLRLSTNALQRLLEVLPYLHTLWFTFDAEGSAMSKDDAPSDETPVSFSDRIKYLIINDIHAGSEDDDMLLGSPESIDVMCDGYTVRDATASLLDCLVHLPTLRRCRLPMFTFPDAQRWHLQSQLPGIEFSRYAPPY